ncbi:Acetylcholinesterase [Strongyloides ratti]|uniref:Acetylcholinesterase n=1 Tax=Strongyloides ratti TaxID=34506 RepID=A0A090KQU0_STRRB|nr:Acetylcholinesterase [Strongyloides ratti]CEF59719.1 Acetylcholinesterase [Strongyloides ratti]
MKMKCSFFLLLFCTNIFCLSFDKKIKTSLGTIYGSTITVNKEDVYEFLGIPYASTTEPENYFGVPIDISEKIFSKNYRRGVSKCSCPQEVNFSNFSGYDDLNPKVGTHFKNCLILNIWMPGKLKNLPVLVFFHDGDWASGTAFSDNYNGSYLAHVTKSIIVVPNFRLGFYGFAFLGYKSQLPGNMGLLDQQMALKWVHNYIKHFNGDKNRVTIMGVGSGSISASAHLFSDGSKNYFQRVFLMSGVITHYINTISPEMARRYTAKVVKALNCRNTNMKITVKCLKEAGYIEIFRATKSINSLFFSRLTQPFLPIHRDGNFFKGNVLTKYTNGDFNKKVDIAIGKTTDEGAHLLSKIFFKNNLFSCPFNPFLSSKIDECNMKKRDYILLFQYLESRFSYIQTNLTFLRIKYGRMTNISYIKKAVMAFSEINVDCSFVDFISQISKFTKKKISIFEFGRRLANSPWPRWVGVTHNDFINLLFGDPYRHPKLYKSSEKTNDINCSHNFMLELKDYLYFKSNTFYEKKPIKNNNINNNMMNKFYPNNGMFNNTNNNFYYNQGMYQNANNNHNMANMINQNMYNNRIMANGVNPNMYYNQLMANGVNQNMLNNQAMTNGFNQYSYYNQGTMNNNNILSNQKMANSFPQQYSSNSGTFSNNNNNNNMNNQNAMQYNSNSNSNNQNNNQENNNQDNNNQENNNEQSRKKRQNNEQDPDMEYMMKQQAIIQQSHQGIQNLYNEQEEIVDRLVDQEVEENEWIDPSTKMTLIANKNCKKEEIRGYKFLITRNGLKSRCQLINKIIMDVIGKSMLE